VRLSLYEPLGGIELAVLNETPDIIAISMTIRTVGIAKSIVEFLSNHKNLFIAVGGVYPTIAFESLFDIQGINAICIGEGEHSFVELCNRLESGIDYSSIYGFCFNIDGHWKVNPPGSVIEDINSLPFADRDIFDFDGVINSSRKRKATFMATRGCDHDCTYCANHAIKNAYTNCRNMSYFRSRTPENVILEINEVLSRYPAVGFVTFQDDTLLFNSNWLDNFAMLYQEHIGLPFCCNARVDEVTAENATRLKNAGCVEVRMGVEAGNDYIRNEILKKHVSKEQIIESFQLLNELDIKTLSLNMMGMPNETEEMILETFELNRKCRPAAARCTIFEARIGTAVYEKYKEHITHYIPNETENAALLGKNDDRFIVESDKISHELSIPILNFLPSTRLAELNEAFLKEFNR